MNAQNSSNTIYQLTEKENNLLLLKGLLNGTYAQYIGLETQLLSAIESIADFRTNNGDEIEHDAEQRRTTFVSILIERFGRTQLGENTHISCQDLLHLEEQLYAALRKQSSKLAEATAKRVTITLGELHTTVPALRKQSSKLAEATAKRVTITLGPVEVNLPTLQVTKELAELRWKLESAIEQLGQLHESDELEPLDIESISDPHTVEELLVLLDYWKVHLVSGGVPEGDGIAAPVYKFFKLSDAERDMVLKMMIGSTPEIIDTL